MERYEKYKPSGIEWIGEVPENWQVRRARFISQLWHGMSYTPKDIVTENEGVLVLRASNIQDNRFAFDDNVYIPLDRIPAIKMVKKGDIVICSTNGSLALVGKSALAKEDMGCSFGSFMMVMRTNQNPSFIQYQLSQMVDLYRGLFATTTINQLTMDMLNDFNFIIPPLAEQEAIAAYLDARCADIDKVVATQEKRIALLKELKQSVITQAVTRGLNPDVKMKDSGVEWIGEVPEHWEVTKTLNVLAMPITDGPHETPILFEEGIPFISAEAVSGGFINFDLMRGYISEEYYKECCKKYIPKIHDIYMIKSGATTGRVAIVETDRIFTIWSPLAAFRANEEVMLPYYLYYMLKSDAYNKQVELAWTFGTQQNIGMRSLERLKVTIPPIEEQKLLVEYLDLHCGKIDRQIEAVTRQIDLLREYKQSLITEVVTGKRKVC